MTLTIEYNARANIFQVACGPIFVGRQLSNEEFDALVRGDVAAAVQLAGDIRRVVTMVAEAKQ